ERAMPPHDGWKGAEQNAQVQPDGPLLDVLPVEANNLFEIDDGAPSAYLPESRETRFCAEPPIVMNLVILHVGLEERAWSHERHLAPEHVEELRQLVETPAPQHPSGSRYARIVRNLEESCIAGMIEVRQE